MKDESMKVTPLHSAATARQVGVAKRLIEHGANVNARQSESGRRRMGISNLRDYCWTTELTLE